ncbi:YqjF family protein, partial [Glycomyces tenuis]
MAAAVTRPGALLTAQWRRLVMLNYEVDPAVLRPRVPRGVELDAHDGRHFLSAVAFQFLDTRLLGVPVPFHRDFDEINLRFYVRRRADEGWRRGVVFVKEIVPRRTLAAVARIAYGERYVARPMRHRINLPGEARSGADAPEGLVEYSWHERSGPQRVRATVSGAAETPAEGSHEEFITEHYWGYTARRHGAAVEYHVTHPRWNVRRADDAALECDVEAVYGREFAPPLAAAPASAFLADGSAVTVHRPTRMRAR